MCLPVSFYRKNIVKIVLAFIKQKTSFVFNCAPLLVISLINFSAFSTVSNVFPSMMTMMKRADLQTLEMVVVA